MSDRCPTGVIGECHMSGDKWPTSRGAVGVQVTRYVVYMVYR